MWIGLLRHPDFDRRDLSSLRKGYYGASIMPVEVLHEMAARLPDVRLFNFYGQTEMAPLATVLRPEDQVRKAGSAGRAALNVETQVVDDDGRPVAAGRGRRDRAPLARTRCSATGTTRTRPPRRSPAAGSTAATSGVLDDEGYLTVVDRKKDMIKTGGENVASREVEEAIYPHPAVAGGGGLRAPRPAWIEAVTAAVVLRDGAAGRAQTELIAFCRERLAAFKAPKHVVLVDELPKNASGKILKRDLRERFAGLAADTA